MPGTKVGQASSAIIDNGSISSDNHITCYNVVMVNLEKRKALMCHVWEGGYGGFSLCQMEDLKSFCSELGDKIAFIVEGTLSTPSWDIVRELKKRDIEMIPVIKVKTFNARWSVNFYLEDQKIIVTDEYGKIHYEGIPFPPFVEVPKDEGGLNDQERIVYKLSRHINPKTKELSKAAQKELKKILDFPNSNIRRGELSSSLLMDFINQRALSAGFKDYSDYFYADPNNSSNIPFGSPELVLRKILGDLYTRRCRERGIDFNQVKVTPQAVVGLLKDYPELLIKLTRSLDLSLQKDRQPVLRIS